MKRDELGDIANPFEQITSYNNFYEFTEDKEGVASSALKFSAEYMGGNHWRVGKQTNDT